MKETSRFRRFARSLPTATRKETLPESRAARVFTGGDAGPVGRNYGPHRGNFAEERLMTRSDSLIRLHSRW